MDITITRSDMGALLYFLVSFVFLYIWKKLVVRILTSRRRVDKNNFIRVIKDYDYKSVKSKLLLSANFILSFVLATIPLKTYGNIGFIIGIIIPFIILNSIDVLLLSRKYNINYRLFILCFAIKTPKIELMVNEIFQIYFKIKNAILKMPDKSKNILIVKMVNMCCEGLIISTAKVFKVQELENELGEELDANFKQFAELRNFILSIDNLETSNSKDMTYIYSSINRKTSDLSHKISTFGQKVRSRSSMLFYRSGWNNRGIHLNDRSKYDEAIQDFDKAIEIDPQYAEAWNNKGNALYAQGKYNEAIQAYDRAIEINSQFAGAWYNKGYTLKLLGRTSVQLPI